MVITSNYNNSYYYKKDMKWVEPGKRSENVIVFVWFHG